MSINKCKNCGCDDALVTLPPCPTPAGCPDPEPCSEVFDAQCIIYTGADIDCGTDTVVTTDTNVATALNEITTYFCQELNQVKLRYVKEISTDFDQTGFTITQAELAACGITPSICSLSGSEPSDFVMSLWYLSGGSWRLIQPYEANGNNYIVSVDDTTGLITIFINRPQGPTVRLRAVLIF